MSRPNILGTTFLAAAALLAVPAAGANRAYHLIAPTGAYSRYVLTLDKATAEQQDVQVHLGCRGGAFPQAWLTFAPAHNVPRSSDAAGLRLTGDRLTGELTAFNLDLRCTIEATVQDGQISGTYKAAWARQERDRQVGEIAGRLSGNIVSEETLRKTCALAAGHDWPACRGPYGSGSAVDCGRGMVDAAEDVQLVWKGECWVPNSYSYGSPEGGNGVQGGHVGPIVADGRVYLSYWEPSGEAYDKATFDNIRNNLTAYFRSRAPEELWLKRYRISADDVVLCLDAATGKLLWKAVFPDRALNIYSRSGRGGMEGRISSKASGHMLPCVRDGRIYALGCIGSVYCLDAADGGLLWESSVGAYRDEMRKVKEQWLAAGKLGEQSTFTVSLNVIGGVLICPQRPGGRGGAHPVMGLDAATGKVLWRDGPQISGGGVPLRWTSGGASAGPRQAKEYAICGGACVEPRSGTVLWTADIEHAKEPGSLTLYEDILIASGTTHGKGGSFNAWRISPTGAKKLWHLDSSYYCQAFKSPAAHRGRLYAFIERTGERRFGMICVELAGGRIAAEMYGEPFRTGQCSSLIQSDGRVVYEKALEIIKADPADFRVLGGTVTVPWAASVTPAIADGRIFIRSGDGVVCYDLRKPGPGTLARLTELKRRALAGLLTDLHGRDAAKMAQAVRRLAGLGSAAEKEILAELNAALDAKDPARFELLLGAAAGGNEALRDGATACVRKALAARQEDLFLAAVKRVEALDMEAAEVRPLLLGALKNGGVALWPAAAEMLLRVDPKAAPEATAALAAAVAAPDVERRNQAALVLAEVALKAPDDASRKAAADAAVPALRKMILFRQRAGEAQAALGKLGVGRPPDAVPMHPKLAPDEPDLNLP